MKGVGTPSNSRSGHDEGRRPGRGDVGDPSISGVRKEDRSTTELAGWHLHAKSRPNDRHVVAAYRQLEHQTDGFFRFLTDDANPRGVRVTFTFLRRPYDSDRELITSIITDRHLEVSVAASDRQRLHPVLDCRPGGPYDRFRAVHDIVGHAFGRRGFDAEGEYSAWRCQNDIYEGLARLALATELRAEHAVLRETGEFAEHKALLTPAAFLPTNGGAGPG